jgi:hypothetical protein
MTPNYGRVHTKATAIHPLTHEQQAARWAAHVEAHAARTALHRQPASLHRTTWADHVARVHLTGRGKPSA